MGGSGTALALQRRLGAAFREYVSGPDIVVLPSLGSTGGIRALSQGALDIALSTRPLTADEYKLNLVATPILTSPVVVVTSHPTVAGVSHRELADIFSGRGQTWVDGAPVRLIFRPKSGVTFIVLAEAFPDLGPEIERARSQLELPVAMTDQENFALAERLSGSLALALLVQVRTEPARIRAIALDGVEPTVANLLAKVYPCACHIHMIVRSDADNATSDLAAFMTTEPGARIIQRFGARPQPTPMTAQHDISEPSHRARRAVVWLSAVVAIAIAIANSICLCRYEVPRRFTSLPAQGHARGSPVGAVHLRF